MFCVLQLSCLEKWSGRYGLTYLSGVDAPDVMPMVIGPFFKNPDVVQSSNGRQGEDEEEEDDKDEDVTATVDFYTAA